MREKEIEQSLRKAVLKRGGLCLKFISPGWSGAPDRLVLLPGGRMGFVELKAPGKRPRPLQAARMRILRRLGFYAEALDDRNSVEEILNDIGRSGNAWERESP
ncbi:MAG: VRR-NUC domain-containing protein [Clostridia bacterium]|nr:VRR-NUC domain-containing protein [Clostridia bacterium]